MKIAIYVPQTHPYSNSAIEDFIVKTLSLLIGQHPDHTLVIITNKEPLDASYFPFNSEVVFIKSPTKNPLLKKLWNNVRIKGILRKMKLDVLVLFENDGPLKMAVPQCIIIPGISTSNIKGAQSLIVMNNAAKQVLIEKNQVPSEKIYVLYPYPDNSFRPVETERRENIKSEYSDGLEFFLYNSLLDRMEDFVSLLKSFSHFKKRQQSSFKLLLLTQSNSPFEKILSNYRYRNDVKFIQAKTRNDEAMVIAAAYAVVLPFDTKEDMFAALNAMQAGVPVITVADSAVNEITGNAAVYAETATTKDIGETMIKLYTDENYRLDLIERGKTIVATFTQERSAGLLWTSVRRALE